MKTNLTNQKNNRKKLVKDLGIGTLINLGFKLNGHWIAEYASTDNAIKNGNIWLPMQNCFKPLPSFYFSSS